MTPPASPQQQVPSFGQRDPRALQLALQSLQAQGAGSTQPSIRATGTMRSSNFDQDATFELIVLGPKTYRTTTTRGTDVYVYTMNDTLGSVLHNGKKAYVMNRSNLDMWGLGKLYSLPG